MLFPGMLASVTMFAIVFCFGVWKLLRKIFGGFSTIYFGGFGSVIGLDYVIRVIIIIMVRVVYMVTVNP